MKGRNKMKKEISYKIKGEWSQVIIRESSKGWIIEITSQVQGTYTDKKLLIPYSNYFPAGKDLWQPYNEYYMTYGDALIDTRWGDNVCQLRRGTLVQ
jgi:hypothetical protein